MISEVMVYLPMVILSLWTMELNITMIKLLYWKNQKGKKYNPYISELRKKSGHINFLDFLCIRSEAKLWNQTNLTRYRYVIERKKTHHSTSILVGIAVKFLPFLVHLVHFITFKWFHRKAVTKNLKRVE